MIYSSFGNTLRRMADEEGDGQKAAQLRLLAAQIEDALNASGNQAQIIVSRIEEKVDDIHRLVQESNTLVSAMADELRGVKAAIRQIEGRLDRKRAELDGMHGEIRDIKQRLDRLEGRDDGRA